jgi:hypothetical protein
MLPQKTDVNRGDCLLYQRHPKTINHIFTILPSLRNIAQVTWIHHVSLLTGRVQGQLRGSELSFLFFTASAAAIFR